MATPKLPLLPFLYPVFYRQAPIRLKPKRNPLRPQPAASFSSGRRRRAETRPNQRYGTANEPPPHLTGSAPTPPTAAELTGLIGGATVAPQVTQQVAADEASAEQDAKSQREKVAIGGGSDSEAQDVQAKQAEAEAATKLAEDMADAEGPIQGPYVSPSNPMDTVLQMPAPSESEDSSKEKPPHLATPRYVHHFDTWRLVGDLSKGGFSSHNSIDIMKAMRVMLADNLEVARDALVSKSNVENESYLFKAACSELKTEIMNNRKAEMEKMRAQRTQLQHEVDVLNMKVDQQLKTMREELKGQFDDRKMNVKMEQRTMESRVRIARGLACGQFTDCDLHRYKRSTTGSPSSSTPMPVARLSRCAGFSHEEPPWP